LTAAFLVVIINTSQQGATMQQSVQLTDAGIMIEFRDAVKPLMGKPLTPEHKVEVGKVALPFHKRLMANGNTPQESAYLLQKVYEHNDHG